MEPAIQPALTLIEETVLDYAGSCGAKHVTALPGVHFGDEKPAESWRRCCDELAWRVEQANQQGGALQRSG